VRALVPILSLKEDNEAFISELEKYKEIILLFSLDAKSMKETFGVEAEHIGEGTKFLERLKLKLETKGKRVFDVVEWGDIIRNIKSIAILRNVDVVAIKEQKSKAFQNFIKELKKEIPNVKILIF